MKTRAYVLTGILILIILIGSCVQECGKKEIAMGVARLSIINISGVGFALAEDTNCGFAAEAVLNAPIVEGTVGSTGSITWTVNNCLLDFGDAGQVVYTECEDIEWLAIGKITVSATKKVTGLLTGSLETPIIPATADSAVITITSGIAADFEVKLSNKDKSLLITSGSLTGVIIPRLAVESTQGACAIQTLNTDYANVALTNASVVLYTPERVIPGIPVEISNISAVAGIKADKENYINGTITTSQGDFTIPVYGDTDGLDPDYDRQTFIDTYSCLEGLVEPISYECADPSLITNATAMGASRLSIQNFSGIVFALAEDTECGFASDAVLNAPTIEGTIGSIGSLTWTVDNCVLNFGDAGRVINTECTGTEWLALGKITVSATKKITGLLTGSPETPIVPATADSALVTIISTTAENYEIQVSSKTESMLINQGSLTGSIMPRLAIDNTQGACSIQTSNAEYANVTLANAVVELNTPEMVINGFPVQTSNLSAVAGVKADKENYLSGTITTGGGDFTIPVSGDTAGLDPDYDAQAFIDRYSCAEGLAVPISYECVDPTPQFAKAGAAALVSAMAVTTKMISLNNGCGYAKPTLVPVFTPCVPPCQTSMTWTVDSCAMGPYPDDTALLPSDCSGTIYYVGGSFDYSGTKTANGILTGIPAAPFITVTRDAAQFVHNFVFNNFTIYKLLAGETEPTLKAVINGTVAVVVSPILGENLTQPIPGRTIYSISTPVMDITGIVLTSGSIMVEYEGISMFLDSASTDLNAFIGSYNGKSNLLSGTVSANGEDITFPEGTTLDPNFDQAAFDASYVCTPGLKEVIPAN